MTGTAWVFVAAAGLLAALDWYAVAAGAWTLERAAKPLVPLALVLAALSGTPAHSGVRGWLVAALALGLLGDTALVFERARPGPVLSEQGGARPGVTTAAREGNELPVRGSLAVRQPAAATRHRRPDRPAMFGLGLLAFLLGHLAYGRAMVAFHSDQLSLVFGLVLVLVALLSFGYRILVGAQALGGGWLTAAVTAYVVALGSAVVLGVGTEQLVIAAGIVLFAVSDLMLAADRFVHPREWSPLAVIVSYHLAQFLLLRGLLGH